MLLLPNDQVIDDLDFTGLRNEAVRDYSAWHEANVQDDNLKAQFRQTCNVALANGLDLKLNLSNLKVGKTIAAIADHH
jgi:hypothetical protein